MHRREQQAGKAPGEGVSHGRGGGTEPLVGPRGLIRGQRVKVGAGDVGHHPCQVAVLLVAESR